MFRFALILALVVAGFYALSTVPDAFIYDDELLVGKEPAPRSTAELARVFVEPHYGELPYYRPLARLTYLGQKAIHGDAPRPYRVANGLLAGLILLVAYGLLRMPVFRIRPLPALLAASWFTLHPIASSCVYPVTGRETLLPTLFGLASTAAWLRSGRGYLVGAVLLFAAALLSKEQAIALPLLLLLIDLGLREERMPPSRLAVRYASLAAVVVAYFLVRGRVLASSSGLQLALPDDPFGPLRSLAYGLQTVFAPYVELVYEPPAASWQSPVRLVVAALFVTALALATHRAPREVRRPIVFWIGWFVVAQLPSANLVVQETPFDERYVFLASLGVAAIAATLLSAAAHVPRLHAAGVAFAAVWILSLALIGTVRADYFQSARVFHAQWVRTNPDSPNAHNGLGAAAARAGDLPAAIESYRTAIRLRPEHDQAHNNLGVALAEQGDPAAAVEHLEQALLLRPGHAEAHYNLANALGSLGRNAQSAEHYRAALALRPGYVRVHNNYGALLAGQGRLDEALTQFAAVIRLDRGHFRARLNHGILLARQGRFEEATADYREALNLDPDSPDAHFDLAVALENLGRPDEAAEHYRQALSRARVAGREKLIAASQAGLGRVGG